ncbi:MAG TPA: hypothetical protein VFW07_26750 [Parafilimonas sp.]|nr:hypothetical protein [Parafilimonas sp.]
MEYTQNRKASTSTIFINPLVTGVTSVGRQKIQLGVGPRINVAAPGGHTSSWGWRAAVSKVEGLRCLTLLKCLTPY